MDWRDIVIKPAISGSAFKTLRVRDLGKFRSLAETHLQDILITGDAVVQPYIPEVETVRERALVFIERTFTHAFRKNAFDTTLGVGESSQERIFPSEEELAFSLRLIDCLPAEPLYVRVDLVPHASGPLPMEVEAIDPSLHFNIAPAAAERLADVVTRIVRCGIVRQSARPA